MYVYTHISLNYLKTAHDYRNRQGSKVGGRGKESKSPKIYAFVNHYNLEVKSLIMVPSITNWKKLEP